MQAPYIPSTDADFSAWLTNFSSLITAMPTDYGLIAGDATAIAAVQAAFESAYVLAINPSTRTPATIAAKDAARTAATALVRPYATQISRSAAVSDALKIGVGVNLPNPTRTPIPAPTTNPDLTHVQSNPLSVIMGYHDSTTPLMKAKPAGVSAIEIVRTIGTAPASDPNAAQFQNLVTKSPFSDSFSAGDVGKIATYWGRWRTKSGPAGISQAGPWSPSLSFAIL